jgi:hypothetical protein
MSRTVVSSQEFWIGAFDHETGVRLPRRLVEAARRIWPSVLAYTKRALGDTDMAAELLEQTVADAVGAGLDPSAPAVRNLPGYLFRSYIRHLRPERLRRKRRISMDCMPEPVQPPEDIERRILAEEILSMMEVDVLDLFLRRGCGFTWVEIGAQLGKDPHALESRYCYELQRIRRLLGVGKSPAAYPRPS